MLHSILNHVLVVLAALPPFGSANPLPEAGVVSDDRCVYQILDHKTFPNYADFQLGPIHSTIAATVNDCYDNCDKNNRCANAFFYPPGKGVHNCNLYEYLSYPGHIDLKDTKETSTLIRLVANSCTVPKRAAKPIPFVCSERTVTVEKGCQYRVKCNVQLHFPDKVTNGFVALSKTARDCATRASKLRNPVGFHWLQGGKCFILESRDFETLKTIPRPHGEVWQMVDGSCSNSTSPPTSGKE